MSCIYDGCVLDGVLVGDIYLLVCIEGCRKVHPLFSCEIGRLYIRFLSAVPLSDIYIELPQ
jgi:hypothetical protein